MLNHMIFTSFSLRKIAESAKNDTRMKIDPVLCLKFKLNFKSFEFPRSNSFFFGLANKRDKKTQSYQISL